MAKTPVPRDAVARFLADVRASDPPAQTDAEPNRILFALDATASREPTWDMAMNLHAELFHAAADHRADGDSGDVAVQLVYYRGFDEFHASPWSNSPQDLVRRMTGVLCRGGLTQIQRVLAHTLAEARTVRVKAAVFVGDACEESRAEVVAAAGRLALFKVPFFLFQEGHDPRVARLFQDIARITGGAYAPFATGSADQLRALFGAVARYATRGRSGLREIEHRLARDMLAQLPR
ncbi:MAG: VWA domain-containing protein [Gammaproteobacteria bacterium]|nr:VWA domain-containing protein [Gammaproteobacteria bacterium]MXY54956.1 VWA domain-containing protein [Gammaproteobacteria bacterium]MYF27358.1 VWA domain-containing protein [Gammaproteobacteria bacterium]MYK46098.1 VWA domain-containing protein [Gammaproteobacteria bacterium]